jgi:hypothetical protein
MINNYDSVETCLLKGSANSKKQESTSFTEKKGTLVSFMTVFLMLFSFVFVQGQTTLISPTGDGGFENGATFAANGWSVANSANNPWIVGPLSNGLITGNAAFISNDGTTPSYNIVNTTSNYFWRDVTVPAGEDVIQLSFNWIANGESTWDLWQVFVAPTSVTPVGGAHPGSGATNVPAAIAGATWVANGNLQTTVQTSTIFLPASLAGTTFRLIFHWKSDTSGGVAPPAQIDNISLTSRAAGTFISIADGNWSNPATWDANAVPTGLDNVTVAAHTVTIDAVGQAANNLTIQGSLEFGATPGTFNVNGNLTIEAGGEFLVFNGTTGKALVVTGNIVNDGNIDLSIGATTAGSLTLNGSAVQSISGAGTFANEVIRNLIFSNTATATPNVIWGFNNIKIANNLNITGARINLNGNKIYFGNNAAGGTFTAPVGTGFINGSFSRWWTTAATGTAITAGTDPTGTASRYPFITSDGSSRALYITRPGAVATGNTAGYLTAVFNDVAGFTTGLSIADGAYTITDRTNGNWQVSEESGYVYVSGTHTLVGFYSGGILVNTNTAARLMNPNSVVGTFQNGSTTPAAQRTGITTTQLTAEPFHIGVNSDDIPFVSVNSGDWSVGTTWDRGTIPTCTDFVTIANGHTVTSTTSGNVARNVTIATGGTLVVSAGDLTVGCTLNNNTLTNNGTLTVSGGLLAVNGNMIHNAASIFNQSGGDILVDGNEGGVATNSVASGVAIVQLNSQFINWTGGALTILDPHANTTASNTLAFNNSTAHVNVPNTHTLKLGDGVSTDAGGNATNGFRLSTFVGSRRISFGNLEVNTTGGTNRQVTTASNIGFNGNVTIEPSSEVVFGTSYVAGNIVNNGTFTSTAVLGLASYTDGTVSATTNAQTIGGSGVYRNLAAAPTANLASLVFNNTNATGVTLNIPLSVSGTLTMTSGIINTTNTNLLTLGTTTAAGILAGTPSATNMVRGPFARTIANANANTNYLLFPVGKVAYAPVWAAPATTAATVMKAETFDTNTGTQSAAIANMATNRRWELPLVSGTISDINVRLGDAGILATSIPVQAPSASGQYTSTFGSVATAVAGVSTQSTTPVLSASYTGFLSYADSNACVGAPAPGNTIASDNTICLGTSVTLSLQNLTTGSGVTYQWFSSTDGVTYAPIATETNPTYSTTPTASTYFMCEVTCATGPSTTASTPVYVTFTNEVTATVPAARCGTGTVDLSATPSSGATINWYAAATGGSPLASGSSFTTPSIASTTTYYAAATTASAGSLILGAGATNSAATAASFLPGGWGGTKTQYIIRASELIQAGLTAGPITNLGFEPTNSGQTYQGFFVQIGHTATTTAPTTTFIPNTGLSFVYAGTEANDGFTPIAGSVNNLTFGTGAGTTSSFVWDGTSNIVVSISWSRVPSATTATATTMKVDNVGFVSAAYRQRDSFTPTDMLNETSVNTTSNNRPRFTINGQLICSSPRVAVVASVSTPPALTLSGANTTICSGDSSSAVTLTSGSGDYDTFMWSPATGVTGDQTIGWTFNPTLTTAYTLTASQTSGALCSTTTASYTVTVNSLPSDLIFTPSDPTICVDAIQALTVSGGILNNAVILSENFNGVTNSWVTQNNSTGTNSALAAWTLRNSGYSYSTYGTFSSNDSSQFYLSNSDAPGSGSVTDTALTSPSFSTLNYTAANISFWHYFRSAGTAKVQYSINGGTSWIDIQSYAATTGAIAGFVQANLVLPAGALNQADVKIRFKYDANWQYFWAIDNVIVSGSQNSTITWSPTTNLYTNAAATIPYTAGTNTTTVYVKSSTAGVYTYEATATVNETGCANGAAVSVTVNANTSNSTTTSACGSYTWAVNGQTYTDGGTYTNVVGCHTETLNLTINALPDTTVTRTDDTLTVAETGATYQWVTCDGGSVYTPIGGASSQSYTVTAVGSYAVEVTKNGCTERSTCFDVTTLSNNSFDLTKLAYYPNPVVDRFTVTYTSAITAIQVYDISGRLVKNITTNSNEVNVDMSDVAASVYIVKVFADNTMGEFKVIKKE